MGTPSGAPGPPGHRRRTHTAETAQPDNSELVIDDLDWAALGDIVWLASAVQSTRPERATTPERPAPEEVEPEHVESADEPPARAVDADLESVLDVGVTPNTDAGAEPVTEEPFGHEVGAPARQRLAVDELRVGELRMRPDLGGAEGLGLHAVDGDPFPVQHPGVPCEEPLWIHPGDAPVHIGDEHVPAARDREEIGTDPEIPDAAHVRLPRRRSPITAIAMVARTAVRTTAGWGARTRV